jgi:hypothetical protein
VKIFSAGRVNNSWPACTYASARKDECFMQCVSLNDESVVKSDGYIKCYVVDRREENCRQTGSTSEVLIPECR